MNKMLYPRLALQNIRKNKSTYFPYILSSITIISLFYVLLAITEQVDDAKFYGGATMSQILGLGVWVILIFSVLVVLYTNSFLMKRRKKELGLYSVLGMEKRHIGRVLFYEVFFVGGFSLICGILSGMLLGKLMFLVYLKILGLPSSITYEIRSKPLVITTVLFLSTYFVIMLFNLTQIHIANPISLLSGGQKGEKEPKAKWIFTIIGMISLGAGYYLALTVQSPLESISVFFIAVILVMIGTYLLFTVGSIAVLKLLRKNKNYYYKKDHFISLSGMMYRMKKNAMGLANICILSTAVLVVLSTTVCLYIGMEDIMHMYFPREVQAECIYTEGTEQKMHEAVSNHAKKHSVSLKNEVRYHRLMKFAVQDGDTIRAEKNGPKFDFSMYDLTMITLDDYNKQVNAQETLNDSEVLLWTDAKDKNMKKVRLGGLNYTVKKQVDNLDFITGFNSITRVKIVVSDLDMLKKIQTEINKGEEKGSYEIDYEYLFDLDGRDADKIEFYSTLRKALNETVERVATVDNIYTSWQSLLGIYGSLFFIGIFIGTLFMITTVLIIYYKQISEGYDDRERFVIMQKVGMSKTEVKKTIHAQILSVFFIPLIGAVIHVAVAFHMINKILILLNLTNVKLFLLCTAATILVFAIGYGIVYAVTAKTYYKIVN